MGFHADKSIFGNSALRYFARGRSRVNGGSTPSKFV